jgi:hypothetical protein
MDVSEVRHTAKRMQKEELRCVLAVIRHGGEGRKGAGRGACGAWMGEGRGEEDQGILFYGSCLVF